MSTQPAVPQQSRIQRRRQQSPTPFSDTLEYSLESSIPHDLNPLSAPSPSHHPSAFAPSHQLAAMSTRLLICSIGNPSPYLSTLHSAGHIVLSSLVSTLSYPPFTESRAHGNGLLSQGSNFTFWQSTSLMNVSGKGVAAAWRQFVKENAGERARLVVVHDELELGLGQVKVKDGGASAKGHNGLKSINALGIGPYTRIGIGIGRPESRHAGVVANYVLKKMTVGERGRIEGSSERVLEELKRLGGV